ncbi:MAG TPA: PH domain-containing protein [Solirubrobacteraceae bacterium]|jgi:uncharacterized membrane protein YdbT with pleckstrin-like domain
METEPGEEVFFTGHPSWRSILAFYLKGLVLTIVAGAIAGIVTRATGRSVDVAWVALVVVVGLLIMVVAGLLRRISTTYTISSRRLAITTGILSKEHHETRLERVQNVNSSQSVVERLLRVGDVQFDTAGSADYNFAFLGVSGPQQIVRTVDRALRDLQQSHPGV